MCQHGTKYGGGAVCGGYMWRLQQFTNVNAPPPAHGFNFSILSYELCLVRRICDVQKLAAAAWPFVVPLLLVLVCLVFGWLRQQSHLKGGGGAGRRPLGGGVDEFHHGGDAGVEPQRLRLLCDLRTPPAPSLQIGTEPMLHHLRHQVTVQRGLTLLRSSRWSNRSWHASVGPGSLRLAIIRNIYCQTCCRKLSGTA